MRRQGLLPRTAFEEERIRQGLCAQCGDKLTGRKKSYCSDECHDEYWIKHSWSVLRSYVLHKRNYICEKCGFQIKRVNDKWFNFEIIAPKDSPMLGARFWYHEKGSAFVVDHIKPIFLGGAEFDQANLQVLCKDCNKVKTKKDMDIYHNIQRGWKSVEGLDLLLDPWYGKYWKERYLRGIGLHKQPVEEDEMQTKLSMWS